VAIEIACAGVLVSRLRVMARQASRTARFERFAQAARSVYRLARLKEPAAATTVR
jgi:hypothetical protein